MKKLFPYILLCVNLLVSFLLIIAYVSPWLPPDDWWLVAFIGTGTTWLMAAHLFFASVWLILKPVRAAYNAFMICLGFSFLADTIQWNYEDKEQEGSLRIVSVNVGVFSYRKDIAQSMIYKLGKLKPDIICVQELFDMGEFNTIEYFKKQSGLPYHAFYPVSDYYGLITFSRYPIIFSEKLNFSIDHLGSNGCLVTDIKYKNKKIRIYNTHLSSMRIQKNLKEIYKAGSKGFVTEKEDVFDLIGKMRASWKKQVPMGEEIRLHMDASPYPVILCGDMNSTPYGYILRNLSYGMQDTYRSKGRGMGFTFRSNFPLLRIDYVFVPEHWYVVRHQVPRMLESDHFPVLAEVMIP